MVDFQLPQSISPYSEFEMEARGRKKICSNNKKRFC